MVGFQGALSQSLRVRLSVWLAIAIVILAVLGACLSYSLALHEANQLQDSQLKQVASLTTASNLPAIEAGSQGYLPEGQVDLKVITDRGATEIQVDDTGPGIPESERERVFDRFYRVLGTDQSGSGLGLSIVQSIATKVGARIALATAGQTGLRVTVTF